MTLDASLGGAGAGDGAGTGAGLDGGAPNETTPIGDVPAGTRGVNASSESDELTICVNWFGLGGEIEIGGGRRERGVAAAPVPVPVPVVVGIRIGFDNATEVCVDVAMRACLASSIADTHSCTNLADPAWR